MPRGDKSSYTNKQQRQAEHIEEGYEKRSLPDKEAERRAWATVNKMTGGGKKSGAGRGKPENHAPAVKGGKLGGSGHHESHVRAGNKAAATRAKSHNNREMPCPEIRSNALVTMFSHKPLRRAVDIRFNRPKLVFHINVESNFALPQTVT
jgi:hypothetical protein